MLTGGEEHESEDNPAMNTGAKVAVITGASQGIGAALVRD